MFPSNCLITRPPSGVLFFLLDVLLLPTTFRLISQSWLDRSWPNWVSMTCDLAPTWHMTLTCTWPLTSIQRSKTWFCYKRHLVLQITCDDDMSWSCDLTLVGAYRVPVDKGSKVIKGSVPVKVWKMFKNSYLTPDQMDLIHTCSEWHMTSAKHSMWPLTSNDLWPWYRGQMLILL